MPLSAISLPVPKPVAAVLPKTRGKSVKELTGKQANCLYSMIDDTCLVNTHLCCFNSHFIC